MCMTIMVVISEFIIMLFTKYFFFQITIHIPLLAALLYMQTQHTANRFETII